MDRLIYLYGLAQTEETASQPLPSLKGFDDIGDLYNVPIGKLTAIVCSLDAEEYAEESIKDRINNDMEWLQEKAFHHHEMVMKLAKMYTLIPLKFCTLYKSEDSLKMAVQSNEAKMLDTFAFITGNEEWNVKIYCEDEQLKKEVSENNPTIEAKRAEISQLPRGKQFFEKKKLDKVIASELEEEKNKVSEHIHSRLSEFAVQGNVKRTWSSEVTGRQEEMTWNGVYLISKSKVEDFLKQIQQYEKDMKEKGWQFQASGPWPAYHFSSFS
ncbi:GvpL/GvpF family gas vesicle protein [Domibacillus sp. 8LH]|uniref:GvpL/GvpF family gas vesicle protein n=1 Tax=Domibacillus sp. 8LH TaxID=3073900 RepID=UPI00316C93FF